MGRDDSALCGARRLPCGATPVRNADRQKLHNLAARYSRPALGPPAGAALLLLVPSSLRLSIPSDTGHSGSTSSTLQHFPCPYQSPRRMRPLRKHTLTLALTSFDIFCSTASNARALQRHGTTSAGSNVIIIVRLEWKRNFGQYEPHHTSKRQRDPKRCHHAHPPSYLSRNGAVSCSASTDC